MERGSSLQKITTFEKSQDASGETPLSIAMERGRGEVDRGV